MPLNIIQSMETDNYISFKMECGCFNHDLHISLEKNENMLEMTFEDDVYIDEDEHGTKLQRFFKRIKRAAEYMFTGHTRIEHSFVFKGNEQFNDFMEYLQQCKDKFKV